MMRLYVFCEGQTEESFVNEILGPHFRDLEVDVIALLLPDKAKVTTRVNKGGWNSYAKAKTFILSVMAKMHADDTWFTTMLDFYALPTDFPQPDNAVALAGVARVTALESVFANDIKTDVLWRFTPYLQLHEYEALLFSDIDALLHFYPNRKDEISALKQDVGDLAPEEVNDMPETAPSKRILNHIPDYAKVVAGTLTAGHIGLPRLRERCPHFNAWIAALEGQVAR